MLPVLAEMYPEVHAQYEAVQDRETELLAELADTRIQLAKAGQEKADMAQSMLHHLGPDSEGQDARLEIAEYLEAHHPAAAKSFRQSVDDGQRH